MFTYEKKMEVHSHEVVDTVRLLGQFGLKFTISDEYCKVDDLDPARKKWFRRITVYGRRRKLNKFCEARKLIYNFRAR